MIPVTKVYLPDKSKYHDYVDRIYTSGWLTNNGVLLQELENRLAKYLGVKHLICVANGSLALQLAYKALGLKDEVITTPFSFVATSSTLVWEGLTPVFVDINPDTFNIDHTQIEQQINANTTAIVPVHVFGNPCEVEAIQLIADKHNLKVIYDAAHAFGTQYKGRSVLNYGDISTMSFHATKLFHTIEGGAVVTNDDTLAKKIRLMINFGISSPVTIESIGINAKMNEFEAAMGLCVLDELEDIKRQRKSIWERYVRGLAESVQLQQWHEDSQNNHAYAPVVFESEQHMLAVQARLNEHDITPRRYFYPSLDALACPQSKQICKNSRDVAGRILCLPAYPGLELVEQNKVIEVVTA